LRWYEHEYPSSYTRTKQIVEQHLLPHFKDHYLDQLAPRLVETWKVDRLEKVKAATVSKELRCFKAMLNRALDWEIIKRHPFARVKAPRQLDDKPISFYSIDEMEAIYRIDPNNRFIWQLMANTGIRRSEALNAKREHVRKGRIRIVSTEDARTKSGKWREVPLSPAANEAILRLGHEYLLPRVYPQSLSRAFKRAAMRADLDGSIHWLRHTFCSHLVMSGVPIKTVQELAGHASINTTMKYAHLAPDYLSNIMDRFHV
jgi:integrase